MTQTVPVDHTHDYMCEYVYLQRHPMHRTAYLLAAHPVANVMVALEEKSGEPSMPLPNFVRIRLADGG